MRWSMVTECGPVRRKNEDALCTCPELGLFVVADGMGGHKAGDVASKLAIDTLRDHIKKNYEAGGVSKELLAVSIRRANDAVYRSAGDNAWKKGMGTTITAFLFKEDFLWVANVGDSRALLLRDGKLSKLTSDHSLVQELIDGGGISEQDAASHPRRNVLTRALGIGPRVEADIYEYRVAPGDRFLICTDGLSGFVNKQRLAQVMALPADAEEIVRLLLQEAIRAGSNDNITMIYLAVE